MGIQTPSSNGRGLSLSEAAQLLQIEPHILVLWEERFKFPASNVVSGVRMYIAAEVERLAEALMRSRSISEAMMIARAG
jgi:DNA-binding transcriptional MerR regulator